MLFIEALAGALNQPEVIEAIALERAWQSNFAATVDTYEATREALWAAAAAEQNWQACCHRHAPPTDFGCNCGQCGPAYIAATLAVAEAKAIHQETVDAFTTGVTPEQLAAVVALMEA